MGVAADELPDGLAIPGRQHFHAAELDSFGDHRIAMAFTIAALCADGDSVIRGAEAAAVSFPEFFETLGRLQAQTS
jgi:3-phosphoshikimate 1-carboxyvinyltransferase